MARVIAALSQHLEPDQLEKTTRTLVHLYEEERGETSTQPGPKPPRWADEEETDEQDELPDLSTSFHPKSRRSARTQPSQPESVSRHSRPRVRFNDEPSTNERRRYVDEYASESSEDDNETIARSYIPAGSNKFRSFRRV